MKKYIYILTTITLLFLFGCTTDENMGDTYKYIRKDTVTVLSHKEFYFYPGTSIKSTHKGYVIVNKNKEKYIVPNIIGFDDIYEKGYEYLIVVNISRPNKLMPDLYGDRYEFISLLKKKAIVNIQY